MRHRDSRHLALSPHAIDTMSSTYQYDAVTIGQVALQTLSAAHRATIMGATSRGLFLRVQGRPDPAPAVGIVFLSYEQYRSPLTINLNRATGPIREAEHGSAVTLTATRIYLPNAGISITLRPEIVWTCPPATGAAHPRLQCTERAHECAQLVLSANHAHGYGVLLPHLLGLTGREPLSKAERAVLDGVVQLRDALEQKQLAPALDAGRQLLGSGRGLTPSGDDLMLGALLLLNRWPHICGEADFLPRFNHHVVRAAYRKTTALSASLIERAAHGEADERLINVVDAIVAGTSPVSDHLPDLMRWGGSSGIDALVGMVVVLTCQEDRYNRPKTSSEH